jgi:hypothetical protein
MFNLPAKPAPERAALYRQLATNLREIATSVDEHLRCEYLELALQYDARAADIWPSDALPTRSKARARPR